jgi:demethylmenaquinone methyltransferase/2-methoxy-6-polyprenyl-1,4-benzoquinol methylase
MPLSDERLKAGIITTVRTEYNAWDKPCIFQGDCGMNRRIDFHSIAHGLNKTDDETLIREFLDWAHMKTGDRVLNVGTGAGVLIPYLMSRVGEAGEITAIDYAPEMIRIGKRKYPYRNVRFICGDVLEMELPIGYFDCVLCYSVFPHFPNPKLAIAKMKSFLKYGGILAICHPMGRKNAISDNSKINPDRALDNLPKMKILLQFLKSSGLLPIFGADSQRLFALYAKKVTPY